MGGIGSAEYSHKINKLRYLRAGKNDLKSLPASVAGCYFEAWRQVMKKPGAIHHEVVPLSEIPKAVLAEATLIGGDKASHAARKRSPLETPLAKKIKVMVVDDESSIADATATVLGTFGYECYAVYNSADAIACAESFIPDVVLSDVIMDGMNGVELCMDIKKMLPNTRILLFSGQVSTAYTLMQDAGKRGHNFELLAKPLRPEE